MTTSSQMKKMPDRKRSADVNPFRVQLIERLSWIPSVVSIKELFERWQQNNFRGQIVGNHGAGKTTSALKIIDLAENKGYKCLYLFANNESMKSDFAQWDKLYSQADKETLVIFDGIDHAPFWKRKKWLKPEHKILCLVHKELKTLPLLCELSPSPDILSRLVEELSGQEGLDLLAKYGGPQKFLNEHKSNLRDCFFTLYKLWKDS